MVMAVASIAAAIAAITANAYYLRLMFMSAVYCLCGLGMNVLVGYTGQKSLGQAGLFAAGAYTVAILTSQFGWGAWSALLASVCISGVFGLIIALPALRVKGPYLAMVTLAFGVVVERTVAEWTDFSGGPQGIFGIQPLSWQGQAFNDRQWVWFTTLLCAVTYMLLQNILAGRHGRALRSLQIDELASSSSGVGVYRYKVLAFVIAAITCGVGGALVAQQAQYFNSDYVAFHLSIFILLVVLLGGSGSRSGPLVGAVVLVMIDALLANWPAVQHLVFGFLLLFGLYVMPNGIAGLFRFKGWPPVELVDKFPLTMASANLGADVVLSVTDLSKAYGGVRPAQNIAMEVRRSHVHALIGPNGAGKSTFINMLTGVVRPDRGSIIFQQREVKGYAPALLCREGIARTFQNLRLFTDMTVIENVLLGQHSRMSNGLFSSMLRLPVAVREEQKALSVASSILRMLNLDEFSMRIAGELPYGIQRRVELARALASTPSLLLLDEPAAGLNEQETKELAQTLIAIRDSGVTILMVEHHMELVMKVSDHVTVLDHGVRIADGDPDAIRKNEAVIEAYLGKAQVEEERDKDEESVDAVG